MLLYVLAGCAAPRVFEESVARAAKDWCMTIRGSQVIPVYPLSEDVIPGDVFLVRSQIQHEQQEYKEKGFLRCRNTLFACIHERRAVIRQINGGESLAHLLHFYCTAAKTLDNQWSG